MYCPNCARENSAEQKFCRACGLSLEGVVELLSEQLPGTTNDKNLSERQRKVDLWARILGASMISLLVLTVLSYISYQLFVLQDDLLPGLVVIVLILGFLAFGLLMFYRDYLAKASKRTLPEPASLPAQDTGKLLPEPSFEPIPSVTERTTDLLTVERSERLEKNG
jgi:hypothetical protein